MSQSKPEIEEFPNDLEPYPAEGIAIDRLTSQPINGIKFNLITHQETFAHIEHWRHSNEREYICISNPHSVRLCHRDPKMAQAHAGSGLTVPDGVGIIHAARILGYHHHGRVTGPMLMLNIINWGQERGYRHFFYGGKEGVPEKLIARLSRRFPKMQVAGYYSPPFKPLSPEEDAAVIQRINATKPDIVWIGLGAPKQEKWMFAHRGRIAAPAMIGVGAAFDFHSGNVQWAPQWMRKTGIEFIYRLAVEPRRMWRRNLDSPIFIFKIIGQRLGRTIGMMPTLLADAKNSPRAMG